MDGNRLLYLPGITGWTEFPYLYGIGSNASAWLTIFLCLSQGLPTPKFMADDEFTVAVGSAVRDAFTTGKTSTPISSMDLLLSLIASKPTACSSHPLRLTDLHRLEIVLESLSSRWEHGSLSLSREGGNLTIIDIHLGNAMADVVNFRKRKRPPVDEEADSAAGDDPDERSSRSITRSPPPSATPLANLGKELREVYAILQRATAKGRLMAERVCGRIPVMRDY